MVHIRPGNEDRMSKRDRPRVALLPVAPLLITESAQEFDCIRDALDQELQPRGIIEQMYVADIAHLAWEIVRLRRCKAGIINSAFCTALKQLLMQFLREPGEYNISLADNAEKLAYAWFSDPAVKKQISNILREFHVDESAIEAEAVRNSITDLEQIERLLASLESRRDKALRFITDYRGGSARKLRESTDRIIEGQVLTLENASSKKPSAAA